MSLLTLESNNKKDLDLLISIAKHLNVKIVDINETQEDSNAEESDFWNELPDSVKKGIEKGLYDIENGNVYSHEEVLNEAAAKYGIKK